MLGSKKRKGRRSSATTGKRGRGKCYSELSRDRKTAWGEKNSNNKKPRNSATGEGLCWIRRKEGGMAKKRDYRRLGSNGPLALSPQREEKKSRKSYYSHPKKAIGTEAWNRLSGTENQKGRGGTKRPFPEKRGRTPLHYPFRKSDR